MKRFSLLAVFALSAVLVGCGDGGTTPIPADTSNNTPPPTKNANAKSAAPNKPAPTGLAD